MGKTRLALQVAARGVAAFPGGVWVTELAAVADAATLLEVIAAALRVSAPPNRPLGEAILSYLRHQQLLVVLDNCEHLLDASAKWSQSVVSSCSGVRILATSREPLGVRGERILAVPSLDVPDAGADLAAIMASDAVRLFCERGADSRHGFVLDAANPRRWRRSAGASTAFRWRWSWRRRGCGRWARPIAQRLDQRFRLLTGGSRTAVDRHRTLRAVVDWSYSQLSAAEQAVLQPRRGVRRRVHACGGRSRRGG